VQSLVCFCIIIYEVLCKSDEFISLTGGLLSGVEECLNGFAYKISQFKDIAARKFIASCAFLFQLSDVSVRVLSYIFIISLRNAHIYVLLFNYPFPAEPGSHGYPLVY